MVLKSERIEVEIQRLKQEQAEAFGVEAEEAEASQARQKAAEQQRQEQEDETRRQLPILLERRRQAEAEAEQKWWDDLRLTCYVAPSNPQFYEWGVCQSFVNYLFADEDQQDCAWCSQCQRGWLNPWRPLLRRYGVGSRPNPLLHG